MKKYGLKAFKLETVENIEDGNQDLVNEREIYWIDKLGSFNNGYNMTFGGQGKDI